MSNKNNTAKSYAEEGLEDVSSELAQAEANIGEASAAPTESDEFVQVGGNEPIAYYLRTSAPKKALKNPYKVIAKGETFTGTYVRSFTGGKFNNTTYLIRNDKGELVGLPSSGSLSKGMSKLAEGSKVKITYNGMQPIKGGQWEGTDAHLFTVFGNKLKA